MQYTLRKKCLLNNEASLEKLASLKKFPVFIGCTNKKESTDLFANMEFDICKKTGFIQLKKLLPLDLIYSGYHSEALGGVWKDHHKELAKFISKYKPLNVLEIGGSNTSLATDIINKNKKINWTIVEPNPNKRSTKKIKIIKKFFNKSFVYKKPVDTIVHSHVLEHLYNPVEMIEYMHEFLNVGAKNIFSVPNLHIWLKNKFPNTLNFEHSIFLTEYFIDYLLEKNGFKILEKKYFKEHSIFYATEKMAEKKSPKIKNKYKEYKKIFLKLISHHEKMVLSLNKKINKFDGEVYLFGGHIFSQYLLYFGLNDKKIVHILDNSKLKQEKRLYGTSLIVKNPNIIRSKGKVAVILRAGAYTEEITKQLLSINKNVKII